MNPHDSKPLASSIYTGTVCHRRFRPEPHDFTYKIMLPFLDVDDIDLALSSHRMWSATKKRPVRFERTDYLGDEATPLGDSVRDLVLERTGRRPTGQIMMLAHLRTWGWNFNPLATYFCLDADGDVEHVIADVCNTPWGEHHEYLVPGDAIADHRFAKELHVSPFLDMDYTYRLNLTTPGESLRLRLANERANGDVDFEAVLDLQRQPLDRRTMTKVLWQYPFMTLRVSLGIHAQAFKLWRKGVPFLTHPSKTPAPLEVPA